MGRYEAPNKGFVQHALEALAPKFASEATATQQQHPWRATIRTWFQMIVSIAAAAPTIYQAILQQDAAQASGGAAIALATATAITRFMALPWTDEFLKKFIPWLASEPKA